tara:strand:- start:338 stop:448 length:111 start_codon:yes stop_codon:yes gene_type:complete
MSNEYSVNGIVKLAATDSVSLNGLGYFQEGTPLSKG